MYMYYVCTHLNHDGQDTIQHWSFHIKFGAQSFSLGTYVMLHSYMHMYVVRYIVLCR
jgi:hypothetical protein